MSKNVDVDLRIRAKNLAGKTLDELNDQVAKLSKSQREQSASAVLAAKGTRELVAEQNLLAATTRELQRRQGLAQAFKDQRVEIGATAQKLRELSAQYKAMQASGKGGGTVIGFSDKDLKKVGAEIVRTNADLDKLIAKNRKAGDSLQALGIDATKLDAGMAELGAAIKASDAAYDGATAAVHRYGAAVEASNAAQAEAVRRQRETAAAVERNRAAFSGTSARAGELAELRADIEARSAAARATEIQAEAARRSAGDLSAQEAAQRRATLAIRESVTAYEQQRQRRADATAAFTGEFAAQERSNGVRSRLVALLNTERGQKILAAEATRRDTTETDKNTGAKNRNAGAVGNANRAMGLFDDTGRKSLSTYQRIRGQVLGLTAAYVGVYQAITTFQNAIAATNRLQALKVSLDVINPGDAENAKADLQFLRAEAERLGLVFDDIAPKFANISIGAKAAGLNNKEIKDTFSNLQLISAGLNLTQEQADRINYASTQIFSKGRVYSEELAGQLGDVLPGAVAEFAKANNIALKDLTKYLKDGKATVQDFTTFLDAYAAKFSGNMDQITGRLQGSINRARSAYNEFLRDLLGGGNEQKLKTAIDRITGFLGSKEGADFANQLVTAVGKLINVFIFLADNIEIVIKAVKAFIAVQVVKFLVDVTTSIGALILKLIGYSSATAAATVQTRLLTAQTRLLAVAFGPVGLAIAGITSAVYLYLDGIREATEETQTFIDTLTELQHARGVEEISASIDKSKKAISEYGDEVDRLVKQRDDLSSFNPIRNLSAQFDSNEIVTREKLTEKINTAMERQKQLIEGVGLAEKNLGRAAAERAQQEADAARERAKAEASAKPTTEDKDKKPKGPTAKQLMSEENARANASRAINKELLDLDQALFDARIDGEIRTQAQIDKNYELQIKKIESEIAEKALALDKLEQDARTANGGVVPADDAESIRLAREKLELLNLARNARAMENGEVQGIQLREKAINDLIAERNAKLALYAAQAEAGTISQGEAYALALKAQDEINAKIRTTVSEFLTFLSTIDPASDLYVKMGIDKVILGLKQVQAEATKITATQQFFKNYSAQIAAGFGNAFTVFAKGIAGAIQGTNSLGDAFSAAGDAFRNFAADFLQQIAEMIIQQYILYAIQVLTGSAQGGFSLSTALQGGYGSKHNGGIAGKKDNGNRTRYVDPRVFAGAQSFHGGGLPGLKPNEVATILEEGEEVVTETNPRHIANAGAAGGGFSQPDITVVNALDSGSIVQQGFQDTGTQRVFMNFLKANKSGIRSMLGIKN